MPLRRLKDKGQGTGKKRQNEKKTYETVGSGCGSLVEQLHPTPEVRGSNPGIGEILSIYSLSTVLKRRK